MPEDEPGLLGNLPRSRPGTRSDKRDSGADPGGPESEKPRSIASKPAAKRSQAAKPGSRRSATAREAAPAKETGTSLRTGSIKSKAPAKGAPTTAAGKAPPKAKPVPVSVSEPRDEGQEAGAGRSGPLRSAANVAGTGLRVAESVTRKVLRRLPRP
jgi:hypothetical protein